MNRIVRENYPVADLPEDLRGDLPPDGVVRVVIEANVESIGAIFEDLMKLRRPPWLTAGQVQAQLDELRGDREL